MNTYRFNALLATLFLAAGSTAASAATTVVDFSSGNAGWVGVGHGDAAGEGVASWIDSSLGNGAPAYRTQIVETFGLHWTTDSNQTFLNAFKQAGPVTIGLDFKANSITYLGNEVSRNIVIELRDYDNLPEGLPYTSVWFNLGTVSAATPGWKNLSVTIDSTTAAALPAGWGGYGAETAEGAPILPADRTFASVLAGVDEVVFTTFVPGMFYGWTDYDVAIDNISLTAAVPEPSVIALHLAGLALLGGMARRRQNRGAQA